MQLPPLTQEPIKYVDMTLDEGLPLRILEAYRRDCDCIWSESSTGEVAENPLLAMMNDIQRQRAKILDRALDALRKEIRDCEARNA